MKGKIGLSISIALLFAGMCIVENNAIRTRPASPTDNDSSVYKLAGEFRVVFANLLWIKADRYHHEFIQRNPNWTHNKELLGMFKMITALDPHFVEAYSTGAYILMKGYKDNSKALIYLRKGISNNPKSSELNELAAIIYARQLNDPKTAIPYAKKAVIFSGSDFQRGVSTRTLHTIERMAKSKN